MIDNIPVFNTNDLGDLPELDTIHKNLSDCLNAVSKKYGPDLVKSDFYINALCSAAVESSQGLNDWIAICADKVKIIDFDKSKIDGTLSVLIKDNDVFLWKKISVSDCILSFDNTNPDKISSDFLSFDKDSSDLKNICIK